MSQHDYIISNQGFASYRSDHNSSLSAIVSNNSGATEPSTTYAYQWWYDETTDTLKMRNSDNDAWITMFTFDQTADTYSLATDVELTITENLDLTGSATISGDLTVDTDTLHVDSGNNRVGVGTNSPITGLDVRGTAGGTAVVIAGADAGGNAEIRVNSGFTSTVPVYSFFFNSNTGIGNPASDTLSIITGAVERMRVTDEGLHLGGTGSANALDDYEEGTWTPVYSSAGGLPSSVTYDRQNGYYYKIGGVVHVWWTLRTDAINTSGMSGDLHVTGMPFNAGGSTNDSVIAGGDAIVNNFLSDTAFTKTGILDNTSTIVFFVEGTHSGTDATAVLKNAANANHMYGHMTYFVDF